MIRLNNRAAIVSSKHEQLLLHFGCLMNMSLLACLREFHTEQEWVIDVDLWTPTIQDIR